MQVLAWSAQTCGILVALAYELAALPDFRTLSTMRLLQRLEYDCSHPAPTTAYGPAGYIRNLESTTPLPATGRASVF